jgi:hypothetical protein
MDAQDVHPAFFVRPIHQYLPVKPSGPQQRRIQNLRPVGRRQDHDRHRPIEPVHFGQQLIERLFLLVLPRHRTDATRPSQRIQFVDEDDARRGLPRLLEQIAHAGGPDAHEHLDELGAVGGIERHTRLPGHRTCQQRLTGPGRPDQQDAARDMRPEPGELFRPLQEVDDLVQFLLGFVHAGHVVEGDLHVGLGHQLGLRATHRQQAAAEAAAAPAHHRPRCEHPDADEQHRRQDPRQQCAERTALGCGAAELHIVLRELGGQVGRHLDGGEVGFAARHGLGQCAVDHIAGDGDLLDLVAS